MYVVSAQIKDTRHLQIAASAQALKAFIVRVRGVILNGGGDNQRPRREHREEGRILRKQTHALCRSAPGSVVFYLAKVK